MRAKTTIISAGVKRCFAALEQAEHTEAARKSWPATLAHDSAGLLTTIIGKKNVPNCREQPSIWATSIGFAEWGADQVQAMHNAGTRLNGHIGLIIGVPGCGKTFLLTAIMAQWANAGHAMPGRSRHHRCDE